MIPKHPFGRTGHHSTRVIFGGAALWSVSQAEADRVLDLLLEYGVNHIDTAANYGDAELRIGPWMEQHRQDFFLGTKTQMRPYQEAHDEIRRSLERLRTDHVDLLQLHYLVDKEEWKTALGPNGALKAALEAKNEGLVRFIGVTGHDVVVAQRHLQSLERYEFDSVLLPYNYTMMQNPSYAAGFEKLLAVCQARNVAVQTIKALAKGAYDAKPKTHTTWYKPITDQPGIDRAVHFVLGRPGLFLNSVGDLTLLPRVLDAANRFQRGPAESEMEADVARLDQKPLFT